MADIFDRDGKLLANIPLSKKQLASLEVAEITMHYHTPQLKRNGPLGNVSGLFRLHKDGERIVADDAEQVRACAKMLEDISDA
jgi:hypothetical protein